MPKAIVSYYVSIEVEATPALMARMLNKEEMEGLYPSDTRAEAWEKLGRWCGLDNQRVSSLDGIADFPDSAVNTQRIDVDLDDVIEIEP